MKKRLLNLLCVGVLLAFAPAAWPQQAERATNTAPRIEITFDPSVSDKPYTGRVFVIASTRIGREPRRQVGWFGCPPFFAQDVTDWKPGQTLVLDAAKALGYPHPLAELPGGKYRVQAVITLNEWARDVLNGAGNGYSEVVEFEHDPGSPKPLQLRITMTVAPRKLEDSKHIKHVKLKSNLLSKFYGSEAHVQAVVGLPRAYYEDATRKFPTIYVISGFGGTIHSGRRMVRTRGYAEAGVDIIVVYIDAECPTGHHVFADSANNGPRGRSLVEELIPHLEKKFRIISDVDARYVTGHSSGGWSSLWLQVAYPDTFGGVWSTSPDPVDFTDFQRINIYDASDNMFTQRDGTLRPLSRGTPMGRLMYKPFSDREVVLGRGDQLFSFEGVFSPRGPDGEPMKLWDRDTGKLNQRVAKAWRAYDIQDIIKTHWNTLGPKLAGKLHLFCGDKDTFLLDGAFMKLRDTLQALGSDAYIEVVPGAGHGLPRSVQLAVRKQVAKQFQERYLKNRER